MRRIRLLTGRVGRGLNQIPGDETDVGDDEAARLVITGQAEWIETAALQSGTETMVTRQVRRRGRPRKDRSL